MAKSEIGNSYQKRMVTKGYQHHCRLNGANVSSASYGSVQRQIRCQNKFLEYNIISIKIRRFLEWKEIILYNEPHPGNSVLNVLLNLSVKGCSRLYSKMKESFDHVLFNISDRWSDITGSDWSTITFSRSFIKHDSYFKDTYLKYIQFHILHKRFYTNAKLFKMGIKY